MSYAGVDASARLPALADDVRFGVRLHGDHSTADVATVVQAIDDLVVGALWGVLAAGFNEADGEHDIERLQAVRSIAYYAYQQLHGQHDAYTASIIDAALSERPGGLGHNDNWELTAYSAANQWLKRELIEEDVELYRQVFSTAVVERVEHNSPLVIVVVVPAAAGIAGVGWLAAHAVGWVYRIRRQRARTRMVEYGVGVARAEERIIALRVELLEQATQSLAEDPNLLEQLKERALDYLLPGADSLVEHPAVEAVEFFDATGTEIPPP